MTEDDKGTEARPYHHGDLRRALIEAARRLLESEGLAALSLRAVAREAGVSPAAPYHHFKDKSELLAAVAEESWSIVAEAMTSASHAAKTEDRLTPAIRAYVDYAREHPALYRVMFDATRERSEKPGEEGSGYDLIRSILRQRAEDASETGIELAVAAAWCASHGLSEMAGFHVFDKLKDQLGGEKPFIAGVLRHMGFSGDETAGG